MLTTKKEPYKLNPVFLLFLGMAWIIKKTPFWLIYIKSEMISFLMYHVIRYRRKVVNENLKNSFPEKSEIEINQISRKYYRHLVDIIFETIKIPGISCEAFYRRIKFLNPEVIENLLAQKRSIIVVCGHSGNFEWTAQQGIYRFRGFDHYNGVVKPLSNPNFEYFMTKRIRECVHKNTAVSFKNAFRTIVSQRGKLSFTYLVADQTPHVSEINYWTKFLNQDTAVFLGTERIAKAVDHAVVYFHVSKPRRGYYEISLELISDTPKTTKEFEITEKHVRLLEEDIKKQPEIWLWSHRRWKYKKDDFDK